MRAVWVELERPDRRDKPRVQRLLICTDPALSALTVISGYAKRWSVESLFKNLKHGFGLKGAWQQSRQALASLVSAATAHLSSSNSALASFRTGASKPSVNQL